MTVWEIERPPGGVDDDFSRALLRLVRSEFSSLPVERVLVWHLPSVVESALPHLVDSLGLSSLAFVGGPPRDFVARALDLVRRRGIPAALFEALGLLGYPESSLDLEENMARSYDGTLAHSGQPWLYGADFKWNVAFLRVTVPATLSIARELELWDVVQLMRRFTTRIVLLVESPSALHVYRDRGDIK